jgi:uncharacterized protein (DUF2164 family)
MFDVTLAKAQHALWNLKLSSYLYGTQDIPPLNMIASSQCYLGKWLYSQGLKDYPDLPEMRLLEQVHQELHTIAHQVILMKMVGNKSAAEQELLKLTPLSTQILALLSKIQQKVGQGVLI